MIVGRDLQRLMADNDQAWTYYLTACELLTCILCLLYVPSPFGGAAALWFFTQTIDEALRRNMWTNDTGPGEYIAFAVLCIGTWIAYKRRRT